jgi:uncharacterized protein (TIGR02145 family)
MRILYHPRRRSVGCVKYGYLYNHYAVKDARNIANTGWHIPTYSEIYTLITTLDPTGGYYANNVGGQGKETGLVYWNTPNTGATNSAGLYFRGAGFRSTNGVFTGIKQNGLIWSSTVISAVSSAGYEAQYNDDDLAYTTGYPYYGCSIRLVKDDDTLASYVGNDGKTYNTIKIGSQVWLAENLAETEYRDHSKIAVVEDPSTWIGMLTGAMCAYDNDYDNVGCGEVKPVETEVNYGLLYNYYAAADSRNIAPAGWHVPTKAEYETLIAELGGSSVAGGIMKSGDFALKQAGTRDYNGTFLNGSLYAYLLTITNIVGVVYNGFVVGAGDSILSGEYLYKVGQSIRLLKDDTNDIGIITDNDGYIYPTITIGSQVWMAANLKTTKYRNGDAIAEVTDASAWAALTSGALCAYDNDWDNV